MTEIDQSLSQLFKKKIFSSENFYFIHIHELKTAHCILVEYCKQGITNFNVIFFCLVINKACTRFD